MYREITSFAKENGIYFEENAPMNKYTSFKTGGPAKLLVMPDGETCLAGIVKLCKNNGLKYCVLGNGSNVLVTDSGFDGVIIKIGSHMSSISLTDDNTIMCSAGTQLKTLCMFALDNSLSGLEFAYGIPGTLGGAAFMNAGAYGGEMKDVLVSCNHIDSDGNLGSIEGADLNLGYRHSVYSDNGYIVTSALLKLKKGDKNEIKKAMDDKLMRRREKQPLEYPSAGSTFKRPEGYFAGALIEECGLKGYSVGGAQVSEKHAGFVINKGCATSSDILNLIEHIQKTVYERYEVMLEPEVRILK